MRSRTPSPRRTRRRSRSRSRSRSISRSRSRSPPGRTSVSRTPEGKRRMIFGIYETDPQIQFQEEANYLEEAKPGDLLVFSGPAQGHNWTKICKMENGQKVWERLPDEDEDYYSGNYGGKRKRKTMRKKRKRTRKCH